MLKPPSKNKPPIDRLIAVMKALRDPENGCPWDLQQNFKTIAPYTIEEAYEVAEAIDNNDIDNLREELGDLLLQSVYHAQMASEAEYFDINDVINDITTKMIKRHPHVFGDENAESPEDVDKIWDHKKSQEIGKKNPKSALSGVPKALPSALRAQKLQKKAAKTGFEWENTDQVIDKLNEELLELQEAKTNTEKTEEFGDILFVMINYGRMLGINAEEALRQCNNKFEKRFRRLEADIKARGLDLKALTLDELEAHWQAVKSAE